MSDRDVAKNSNWRTRDVVCRSCTTTGTYDTIAQGQCSKCRRATCVGCRAGSSEDRDALCSACGAGATFETQPWVTFEYVDPPVHVVPFPGKGENSWDCGEDAIMGAGADEPTPEAAVASVVKSALRNRRRYGGEGWKPEKPAPVLAVE